MIISPFHRQQHNAAPQPPTSYSQSATGAGASSAGAGFDTSLSFGLDPYTAKQMAALQATSLAKAGNRSAPGGTSVPNFGGMSMNQPSPFPRSDSGAQQDNHAFSAVSDLQASNQQLNVSLAYLSSFPSCLMQSLFLWTSPTSRK